MRQDVAFTERIELEEVVACEKEKEFEKIYKEIYGNGREGMKDKLVKMQANLKLNTWLTALVAGGVISAVIKGLFG